MADYNMNGFRVRFRIADYASDPMVMAITATAEDDEFDVVLSVNIGSSIGNGTLIPRNCAQLRLHRHQQQSDRRGLPAEHRCKAVRTLRRAGLRIQRILPLPALRISG